MDQEFKISAVNTPKEVREHVNKDKKKVPQKNQEEILYVKKVSNKIKNIVDGINGRTDTRTISELEDQIEKFSRMQQKRVRQKEKRYFKG